MQPETTPGSDASMVIKLTLDAFTAEKLLVTKPRSLPTATFCALLIEQALDTPVTLAERTEGSEASSSSSSNKEDTSIKQSIKAVSAKKKRVRPDYSDSFNEFWNVYQRAPIKANAQSKNKAFEQWKQIVKPPGGRWRRSSRQRCRMSGAHPFLTLSAGFGMSGTPFCSKTTSLLVRA